VSILNGPAVATLFNPRSPIVDQNGVPTTAYGRGFLQALFARTGSGTGIVPSVTPAANLLIAAGSSIKDALQLTSDWNLVGTVPNNSGVAIASQLNLQPGNDIWVFNLDSNNLNVYPPSGSVIIDQLSAGSPYVLAAHRSRCFQCLTATLFYSYGN
jgi:hypothetical protein